MTEIKEKQAGQNKKNCTVFLSLGLRLLPLLLEPLIVVAAAAGDAGERQRADGREREGFYVQERKCNVGELKSKPKRERDCGHDNWKEAMGA